MAEDSQLLSRFAKERSESEFGELVARHLPLVYSTALRQTAGDAHLAKDISQLVFADLARKAPSLSENIILAGWLHRATVFAARQTLRGENRRRLREQHAVTMNAISSESESADWQQIRPILDEALDRLDKTDRDALLLRFFEQQSLAQIGATLGGSEDAVRKRIVRALEKLRSILQKRGVTTTAAVLSATISANAIQTVPTGLAATLTTASLTIAAATGTTLTLLKIMTFTPLKAGIVALALASAATACIVSHQAQVRLREENQTLQQQIAQLQSDSADFSNRLAEAAGTKKLSDDQFNELLQLRGEVGMLRNQTNEMGKLRSQLLHSLQDTAGRQSADNSASNQDLQIARANVSDARQVALQMILYANDHQGFFPTNLDLTSPYTSQYPMSGTNHFEIAYQGLLNAITNRSSAILIQSDPWETSQGKWAKAYGFADGHAELHTEANGDFTTFEQQHVALPLPDTQ